MSLRPLLPWSVLFGIGLPLLPPALSADKVWTGNGSWSDPSLWSPPGVPDSTDEIRIHSGSVNLGGTIEVGHRLIWTGGTVLNGILRIAPDATAELSGSDPKRLSIASISVAGTMLFLDDGPLELAINGYGQSVTVTNEPTGRIRIEGSAGWVVINPSGYPPALLHLANFGTLTQSGTASPELSNVPLHNSGLVDVQSGALRLAGGGQSSGLFRIHTNASLECRSGSFNFTHARIEGGPARIRGNLRLAGLVQADDLRLEEGTVDGDCEVTGGFTWSGGHLHSMQLVLGNGTHRITGPDPKTLLNANLRNLGQLLIDDTTVSAQFTGYGQAVSVTNAPGGTLILSGSSTLNQINPSGYPPGNLLLHNEGLVRSTGNHRIQDIPIHQAGRIEVTEGVLRFNGGGSGHGQFHMAPGARIELATATFDLHGSQWTGTARITGSTTLRGTFDATDLGLEAGDLTGAFQVNGSFNWSGGRISSAQARLGPGNHRIHGPDDKSFLNSTLNNAGHLVLDSTTLGALFTGYSQSVLLTNEPNATLEFTGGSRFEQRNPSGYPPSALAVVNEGLVRSSGSNALVAIALHNRGQFQVDSDVLEHSGDGISTGSFSIAPGARFNFRSGHHQLDASQWTGTARIIGSTTLQGTFDATDLGLEAGDLAGAFQVNGSFNWSGGRISSAQARLGPGNHRIHGPDDKSFLNSTLNNAGHLVLDSTTLGALFTGYSQSVLLTNEPNATLEFTGGSRFEQRNPSGYPPSALAVVNEGLVRSSGSNALVAIALHNRGQFQVDSDVLEHSGGGISTGSFSIAAGARFDIQSGSFQLNHSQWSGPGRARLVDHATLTGDFVATNLELAGGSISGNFGVSGAFLWTGGNLSSAELRLGPGTHRVEGAAPKSVLTSTIRNAGSLSISNAVLDLQFTGYNQSALLINEPDGLLELVDQAGLRQLNPSGYPPIDVGLRNSGTLRSTGTATNRLADIPLVNSGTVEVLAPLHSNASIQLSPTSHARITLDATPLLQTTATLQLGGTLGVFTRPGHNATANQQFALVTGNPTSGNFTNTNAPNPGHVFHYDIALHQNQVFLTAFSTVTEPPTFEPVTAPNDIFLTRILIQPGMLYRIESSPDLIHWHLDATGTSDGSVSIEDAQALDLPARFFRVNLVP